jgi:hypothetical protein
MIDYSCCLDLGALMLYEDDVVEAVCAALVSRGFRIDFRARTTQHGHDVVARKDESTVIVEAKGAGSSKPGTSRFGHEFTSGQVFDHVAKAILKALRVIAEGDAIGVIALPSNAAHRSEVERAQPAIRNAGIVVAWVTDQGVTFDPPTTIQ